MLKPRPLVIIALTAIGLVVAPFVLPHLGLAPTTVNRILVWGLFGLGFDILFGFTGLLSFGQSAFFGTGGMVAAYLLTETSFSNVIVALVVGMIAAAAVGFLVGLIALRRTGIYFAMITVAIAEVFYFVEFSPLSEFTGGENGLPGVPTPSLGLGFTTVTFDSDRSIYVFLAFWFFVGAGDRAAHRALAGRRRPAGDSRQSAARGGGRPRYPRYKLTAFVIASAYAGFAGGLLGLMQGFMPPDAFTFDTSGQLVMQTAIGGAGTLFGPLVGAAIWLYLSDFFQNTLHLGSIWKLVLGIVFVLLVIFLRHGVIGGVIDLAALVRGRAGKPHEAPEGAQDPVRASSDAPRAAAAPSDAGGRDRSGSRRRRDPRDEGAHAPLRRTCGQPRHRFRHPPWRTARRHRPERRGQEHVLQDADPRGRALVRPDPVREPRHHRLGRDPRLPARPDQKLPGQSAVQSADRARERRHRRAGRAARPLPRRSPARRLARARARQAGRGNARLSSV